MVLSKASRQLAIALFGVLLVAFSAGAQNPNRKPPRHRPHDADGKVTQAVLKIPRMQHSEAECPADFWQGGFITTDGPADVKYTWVSSDGRAWPDHTLKFSAKGYKDVSASWTVGKPGQHFQGWLQLKVIAPNAVTSNRANVHVRCLK